MKKLMSIILSLALMCSATTALASSSETQNRASYNTVRLTVDVPFTIPEQTVSCSIISASKTFDAFDSICTVVVDTVVNLNTGKISSFSVVSYGVKPGYSGPWGRIDMVIKQLTLPNGANDGISISSTGYGLDFNLEITANVQYKISGIGADVAACTVPIVFDKLMGTAYAEAA